MLFFDLIAVGNLLLDIELEAKINQTQMEKKSQSISPEQNWEQNWLS